MNIMKKENEFLDVAIGLSNEKKWDTDKLSRIEALIKQESKKQSKARILKNNMLAIQYEIEDYLENEKISVDKTLEIGHFVKLYLDEMNLTKIKFANILELQPSNLHKYLTGTRKLNADLALKFSYFFNTKPEMWIMIQAKNEIVQMKLEKGNVSKYQKYNYKNILGIDVVIKGEKRSKRDKLIAKYAADIKDKIGHTPDMDLLTKVTIGCGPSIYNADRATVSSSDQRELDTVKKKFLMKKLGLSDSQKLDEAITSVIEQYGKSNRNKYRAVVYYMLTKMLDKESVYK